MIHPLPIINIRRSIRGNGSGGSSVIISSRPSGPVQLHFKREGEVVLEDGRAGLGGGDAEDCVEEEEEGEEGEGSADVDSETEGEGGHGLVLW